MLAGHGAHHRRLIWPPAPRAAVESVQFHPESILPAMALLGNSLARCGDRAAGQATLRGGARTPNANIHESVAACRQAATRKNKPRRAAGTHPALKADTLAAVVRLGGARLPGQRAREHLLRPQSGWEALWSCSGTCAPSVPPRPPRAHRHSALEDSSQELRAPWLRSSRRPSMTASS